MPLNTHFDRNRPRYVKHFLVKETMSCGCGVTEDVVGHLDSFRKKNLKKRAEYIRTTKKHPAFPQSETVKEENAERLALKLRLLKEDESGWDSSNALYPWANSMLNNSSRNVEIRREIRDFKGSSLKSERSKNTTIPRNWEKNFEVFSQWVNENKRLPKRGVDSMYWFMDKTRRYISAGDKLPKTLISKYKLVLLKGKGYDI